MTTPAEPVRLLDVNALVALSLEHHVHHETVTAWFAGVREWGTCSTTQSAFVRLLLNPHVVGFSIAPSAVLAGLTELTTAGGHRALADDATFTAPFIDLTALTGPKQVTDFHLVNLAASQGAVLATMDSRLHAALAPDDRRHVELLPV